MALPNATLLVAPNCLYCHSMTTILETLQKKGLLGELRIIDVSHNPEEAETRGVRGVPWTQIGVFEFQGLHTEKELAQWIKKAGSNTGLGDYIDYLLTNGQLSLVSRLVARNPTWLESVILLLDRPDLGLNTRIGISAVIESLQGSRELVAVVDRLGILTKSSDSQKRADACYYLGLSRDSGAIVYIEPLLKDDNTEVREIARESLDLLRQEIKP
ncbi:MAG: thioredoxin family protein [Gammaproteobacteria bacterium]|nr:thioredoxin family protein [Gammaproteobacteria bacterium]